MDIAKIATKKHDNLRMTGVPTSAWMGNLFKVFPGLGDLAWFAMGKGVSDRFALLGERLPNHQWIHFLLGYSRFADLNYRLSYEAFAQAAKCDSSSTKMQTRAAWLAFGSLVTDGIFSKTEPEPRELVELLQIIERNRVKDGKYDFLPWDAASAWSFLVRTRMYKAALELAQQELEMAVESEKLQWESKMAGLRELIETTDSETERLLFPPKDRN